MLLYPERISEKIGFQPIREEAVKAARSVMGKERLEKLVPYSDRERVERLLRLTREMIDLQRNDAAFPLENLHDIRDYLKRSKAEGSLLPAESLLEIWQVSVTARRIKQYLDQRDDYYPSLNNLAVGLIPMENLEETIRHAIDEHGNVKDDASSDLKRIRNTLNRKRTDLRTTINRVMSRAQKQGMASDEGPTIRNGRMVIPIQAEYKRKIQGFIHDVSSTGQTVYLEPVEALNINNEIRQLESEEKREIERILKELTDEVRDRRDYLDQNIEVLGTFDVVAAKAHVSMKLDGFVPVISDGSYIRLKEAYNPILLLRNLSLPKERREPVIPLSLDLEEEERCLIITGPNAGGKSVAMKTLGLCVMMVQSGFAVPAKDTSELPVFSSIFVDMGDDQSIENDLSTFSSRLEWMKQAVGNADERSLILIDEAGAGTDPEEGGALFQALIETLIQKGAIVLVTTHHGSLKLFAHEHPKAVNGSMEFDQATLSPTYRFKKGVPGSSYAFEIAQRMDLDTSLLDNARNILGESKQNLESLITELESRAQQAEELRKEYEKRKSEMETKRSRYEEKRSAIERERDEIREKALKEAKEIMQSANRRIEEAVEKIVQQDQKDKEVIKEAREEVGKHKDQVEGELDELEKKSKQRKKEKISDEPPAVGDTVRLMDTNTNGELVEVSGGHAVVQSGGLRLKTNYDNLIKVEDAGSSSKEDKNRVNVNVVGGSTRRRVKPTLDVRGLRGPEAVTEVTHYIDDAVAAGLQQVEIIHGKGEGILKKLIHEYLENRNEVKEYRLAPADQGGAGCTIVTLK